jgi:hypothetical protein
VTCYWSHALGAVLWRVRRALLPASRQVTARTLAEILDNAGKGRPAADGDVGSCRAPTESGCGPWTALGRMPAGRIRAPWPPKRWRHLAIPPGTTPPGENQFQGRATRMRRTTTQAVTGGHKEESQ